MNLSQRSVLLLLSAWLLSNQPAQAAANLNDFLTHGYHIASRTEVVGTFKGCEKDHSVMLRDKSVFSCATLVLHRAYAPTAFILATSDMPPKFAVLIDGQPYSGSLLRLAGKQFRHPALVGNTIESSATETARSRPFYATAPFVPLTPTQPGLPAPGEDSEKPHGKSAVR